MNFQRMTDLDLAGKRVLIREDLNVPVKNGVITSDARLRAALPTIKTALEKGAAVMVYSHLGRPVEGEPKAEQSLAPVAAYLTEALGQEVKLLTDYLDGVEVQAGQVVLLENCRFNVGEKKNNPELAASTIQISLALSPSSPEKSAMALFTSSCWERKSKILP